MVTEFPQRQHSALRELGVPNAVTSRSVPDDDVPRAARHRVSSLTSQHATAVGMDSLRILSPAVLADRVAPLREGPLAEIDDSVTGMIQAWSDGDSVAGDRLFARVYSELRTIAHRLHRRRTAAGDDTLDTTALVHEVYLRLAGAADLSVQNRSHFFAVAARATRQILSNYARDAQALKRGGTAVPEPLDGIAEQRLAVEASDDLGDRAAALDAALQQLERVHPRPCRVVECRYFGGLSIPETALALDISEATVKRDWAVAQAWLHRALRDLRDVDG